MKMHWDYHIPINLKTAEGIKDKAEVWPGLALSTGVDNLQDVARLRNLSMARTAAAQNMYDVYKNTNNKLDRRHFELLARNAHPYVKIEKAPYGFGALAGEVLEFEKFRELAAKAPVQDAALSQALGLVLAGEQGGFGPGTEIDLVVSQELARQKIDKVKVAAGLEISAVTLPMSRVLDKSADWLGAMNHRRLKDVVQNAASFGGKSDLHGYNPITAYAYGAEMRQGKDGSY
jgi:hypothetical protein